MVKLMSLTLLDGLLRSQCVQGTFCFDKNYKLIKSSSKSKDSKKLPGTIFTIRDNKLLKWCNSPSILKCLSGRKIGSSQVFIEGCSAQDALEFSLGQMLIIQNFYPKFFRVFTLDEQLECFRRLLTVPKKYVIKVQKYMTAEAPCIYLEQKEHNPKPDCFDNFFPNVLGFSGRVKRFLENRLFRKNGKNRHFWNSYLQGIKRCCHEAENEVLYDEYLKHRETLTKEPKGSLDKTVKTYMKRAVEHVKINKVRLFEASTSASFSTPRSKGGQRADVRNWLMERYGSGIVDQFVDNKTTYLLEGPKIPKTDILAKDICDDFIYNDCRIRRPLKVKVHGILEPLKVRKITKGEAVPYWFCRSLQKDLHKSLQAYPQYRPTGRPIQRFDIHELIARERAIESQVPLGFDGWVSGDYSAATDGVDIRVTMGLLEIVLSNSPYDENMKEIARAVLGPQELHYPKISNKPVIEPALQKTGQLMGSILSFPILCYINIITYWMTLEQYTGHVYELKDLPCIVNGDDILFRANQRFYDMWKENIGKVGFTMSIGKNYFHPNTFLINSQMYHIDGNIYRGKYHLTKTMFYNPGLLTGKAKVTGRAWERMVPLWSWYQTVMDGAYDRWDAHKKFLHYHKNVIETLTSNGLRNLFVSRWLGGCGFKIYKEIFPHIKVTAAQGCVASYTRYRIDQACKTGVHPGKFTIRLAQEDVNDFSAYYKGFNNEVDRAYTTLDLGLYDKYKLIPRTQPLNYNESLDLTRQHNLPLLANIPNNFDKRDLVMKYHYNFTYKQSARWMSRNELKPLPKSVLLSQIEYRLVSVRDDTLGELLSRDDEGNTPDLVPDFSNSVQKYDKFRTGDLGNNLQIVTTDHHVWNLHLVEQRKLFGGISLVIHQED